MPKTAVIYETDFKKGKVVKVRGGYTKYSWKCLTCITPFIYDSRKGDNTKHITIDTARGKKYICDGCVKDMYDIIEEE